MNDNIRELREEAMELLYDRLINQIKDNSDDESLKVTMNLINDSERNHNTDIKMSVNDANETAKIDIEADKLEFEKLKEERRELEREHDAAKEKMQFIVSCIGIGVSALGVIATLTKGAMIMRSNHNNLVDYLNIEREVGKPQNEALRLGVTNPMDLFK